MLRKKIPERRVSCRFSVFILIFGQLSQLCFLEFGLAIAQSVQNKEFFEYAYTYEILNEKLHFVCTDKYS